jgi:hypothetical protein
MTERFDPKSAPQDKTQQPHEKGDSGAGKISFHDVHDGKTEATRPGESTIDKLEREIAATTKAFTDSIANAAEKFKSLAQLPADHEFHPNQVMQAYSGEKGSPQQKLVEAVKGNIQPHEVFKS